MSKVLIFSHESDIDGLGCVVLGKLAFSNIDFKLVSNIEELELLFRDYIKSGKLNNYEKIFVTDLALYDPSLTMVEETELKDKVLIFDHHKRAIEDGMNRYNFTTIIEEDDNGKRCGCDLFYEYLRQNNLISLTTAISEFVELTRLEDTWEWKKNSQDGERAHDLAILFNAIGIDEYLGQMTLNLVNNSESFSLNNNQSKIVQSKKDEYNKLLCDLLKNAEYFFDENGYKYGIVFADYEYRNELAEYIRNNNNPDSIKYFIVVAMNKGEFGQKSYRSIDETFDVNEVAMNHGGGGHPAAASVSITQEQKEKSLTLTKRNSLKFLAESNYS